MTNTDEYNGWTNRETWAINLWISNDEMMNDDAQRIAEELTPDSWTSGMSDKEYGAGKCEDVGVELVDYVKDYIRSHADDEYASVEGMRDDIGSFWRIDTVELGAVWITNTLEARDYV